MQFFSEAEVYDRMSPALARQALETVLRSPFDPERDPLRETTVSQNGELLSMPSAIPGWTGAKLITVAPNNPGHGLPRIQGVYVLFDSDTMAPQAVIDAASLTLLRTPAMSALAADKLARPAAKSALVIGTGPQAIAHVQALAEVRTLETVWVRGRSTTRQAVDKLRALGFDARQWEPGVRADIVACCTSASEPVMSAEDIAEGGCVIAMGSHSPDAREVPTEVMREAQVVIESRKTTLQEGGDVIIPLKEGAISESELTTIKQVVCGECERDWSHPAVFKGTGMSWQDLAVAALLGKQT